MFQPDYTQIPPEIVGELSVYLISPVPGIINVRIDRSTTGATYLVVPFSKPNESYAILVEISEERLSVIKNRAMKLIFPFQQPEKKLFYLAQLNGDKQIEKLAFLYPEQRKFEWPIPDSVDFDLNFVEKKKEFSLKQYAIQKQKAAIEIIFESDELQKNMTVSAIEKFLMPFTTLVKTALMARSTSLNCTNVEGMFNMGFSLIEHKCLRAIIDFDYNPNLIQEDIAFENLRNMYLMLDADEKVELEQYIDGFENKKIISDTIRILRTVIAAKGTVTSRFSTPIEEYKQIMLNSTRARRKKRMLEVDIAAKPYERELTAFLTMLSFNSNRGPMFAIQPVDTDQPIVGKICAKLAETLNEQSVTFNTAEYKCKLNVLYTPETSLSKEKTEYTLLEFEEVIDDQLSI